MALSLVFPSGADGTRPDLHLFIKKKKSCSKSDVWAMFLVPSGSCEMSQQERRQHQCLEVGILQRESPKHFRTILERRMPGTVRCWLSKRARDLQGPGKCIMKEDQTEFTTTEIVCIFNQIILEAIGIWEVLLGFPSILPWSRSQLSSMNQWTIVTLLGNMKHQLVIEIKFSDSQGLHFEIYVFVS